MKLNTTTLDTIELRSEKVRRITGEIPPSLIRWSITIMAIIISTLIAVVCLMPYPYSNGESILRHLLLAET